MLDESFCADICLNQSRMRAPSPDLFSDTDSPSSQKLDDFTLSQQEVIDSLVDKENQTLQSPLKGSRKQNGLASNDKVSLLDRNNSLTELELFNVSTTNVSSAEKNKNTAIVSPVSSDKSILPKNQSFLKTLRSKLLWGEDIRNKTNL